MPLPLPALAQPAGNVRAIGTMLLGGLFFAAMHTAIRHVADLGVHPFEIAFFRNVFGLLVVMPWVLRYGLAVLKTARPGLHATRGAITTAAMLAHFTAMAISPLAQVTALTFAAPIFATVLAVLILKEIVGWRRWIAILSGFTGTLITVRFGFEGIGIGPALAIAGTIGGGINIIIVKVLGRTESAITITAYMSMMTAPLSLLAAAFFWTWPTWEQLAWMAFIGIAGNIGQVLMVQALHDGDTNVVMPFDYMRLLWVALIAFAALGQVPDRYTWAGGTVIFASAAYIAYRERQRARRQAAATAAAASTAGPPPPPPSGPGKAN